MHRLSLEGKRTMVTLHTMGKDQTDKCFRLTGLELCNLDYSNVVQLPPILSQKRLPISSADVVYTSDLKDWSYLKNIPLLRINSNVDLLIGVNVPRAMETWEMNSSQNNGPFAVKTVFGWVINGPLEAKNCLAQNAFVHVSVNRIEVSLAPSLDEQLKRYFNHDFCERAVNDISEPSKEEKQFLDLVEKSAKLEDGHYVVDLPFCDQHVLMPNNKRQAERRLWLLSKRLKSDVKFCQEYKELKTGMPKENRLIV